MRARLVIVALSVIAAAINSRAAVVDAPRVVVRLYDVSGLARDEVRQAAQAATDSLAPALVSITWLECRRNDGAARCERPMRAGELAVRVVRSGVAIDGRGRLPLGDALVDEPSGTGALATIYTDRIEWLAQASSTRTSTLLTRVIAHELGHLLLGSRQHSARGLMRAAWSIEDVRRTRPGDWEFTVPEAKAIHARARATVSATIAQGAE